MNRELKIIWIRLGPPEEWDERALKEASEWVQEK